MLQVLSIMSKVLFSPFWLLWKGYNVLWWAFEGFGRPAAVTNAATGPERGNAFEITDSRPLDSERPAPIGLLRAGFAGSLFVSGAAAIVAGGLAQSHTLSATHSWLVWMWASVVSCVVSIFAVRRVHEIRSAKRNWRQRVRDAVANAGRRAAQATSSTMNAARNAVHAAPPVDDAGSPGAGSIPAPAADTSINKSNTDFATRLKRAAAGAAVFSRHVGHSAWEGGRHAAATFRAVRAASNPTSTQANSKGA